MCLINTFQNLRLVILFLKSYPMKQEEFGKAVIGLGYSEGAGLLRFLQNPS